MCFQEKLEDSEAVNSKDRQYNSQQKRTKRQTTIFFKLSKKKVNGTSNINTKA
jgi:hypothetical protein